MPVRKSATSIRSLDKTDMANALSSQLAVHCLYFFPLPQGQGSLRPTRGTTTGGAEFTVSRL
jgi:hypothetical protein